MGVEAHVMSADSLDLPDESFDLVVASFMIHIVRRPEATVDEALRVLKSGGRIVLTVPGRADDEPDPWEDEVNDLVRSYRRYLPDGDGRHGNDADVRELLKDRGVQGLFGNSVDIALPVPDGDTYWRWMTSHGAGTFAKRLPDDKRQELYRDLGALISKSGGWKVRRSATDVCSCSHRLAPAETRPHTPGVTHFFSHGARSDAGAAAAAGLYGPPFILLLRRFPDTARANVRQGAPPPSSGGHDAHSTAPSASDRQPRVRL